VQTRLEHRVWGLQGQCPGFHGHVQAYAHDREPLHAPEAHHHDHVVTQTGAPGRVAQGHLLRPDLVGRQWEVRLDVPAHVHARMITQVLPNAGGIVHHGNPETVKLTGRTHAGQHEQVW
jgi:hypothetical protein